MVNTRNEIVEVLENGIMVVKFTKVDGTERTMRCTRDRKLMPVSEQKVERITEDVTVVNENVVRAYDLLENAWRSFRVNQIISASVVA